MIKSGIIETSVLVKEYKIPNLSSSAVPKKYKRNSVLGDFWLVVRNLRSETRSFWFEPCCELLVEVRSLQ